MAQPLTNLGVLLIEDETTISFLMEDMLRDLGAVEVWHAATVEAGLGLLEQQSPALAVLDVNLGGKPVYPVAERLKGRGIPFVFITGYGRDGVDKAWAENPVVQKPMTMSQLERALTELLAAGA